MDRRNFIRSMLLAASAPAIVRASSIMAISAPVIKTRQEMLADIYFDAALDAYDYAAYQENINHAIRETGDVFASMSDRIWSPKQRDIITSRHDDPVYRGDFNLLRKMSEQR